MCGIAGTFAYHPDAPLPDPAEIRRMTDAMASRGPDGQGLWTSPGEGRVILGHRRLSILDLSEAGSQPMLSADGRLAVTINGEGYNCCALRRGMESAHQYLLLAPLDALGPDQDRRILDLGCGSDFLAKRLHGGVRPSAIVRKALGAIPPAAMLSGKLGFDLQTRYKKESSKYSKIIEQITLAICIEPIKSPKQYEKIKLSTLKLV